MSLHVVTPGALTSVQDLGRIGWRHLGIGSAGALDSAAARLANALVGNPPDAAVLEFSLQGPTLVLDAASCIAICGATVQARYSGADGNEQILDAGRRYELPAGRLELGRLRGSLRGWIAFAGGIDVPPVMNSRSTDLRAGFGGHQGRALAAGDVLQLGSCNSPTINRFRRASWSIYTGAALPAPAVLRYVASAHPAAQALAASAWRVDPRSNRQGLRLQGLSLETDARDLVSAAVAAGTIQLPPDGQPIILLADAQTVGGYPRLGHVVAADQALFAQLAAPATLQLQAVSTGQARELWLARQLELSRLEAAIALRLQQDLA